MTLKSCKKLTENAWVEITESGIKFLAVRLSIAGDRVHIYVYTLEVSQATIIKEYENFHRASKWYITVCSNSK